MEYEQKYNAALERAAKLRVQNPFDTIGQMVEHIFPELKKSEDERIRKGLIKAVSRIFEGNKLFDTDVTREEALTWLEKQGESEGKESDDELTWLKTFIEEEAYYLSMDIRDEVDREKLIKLQNAFAWLEKQSKQEPYGQRKKCSNCQFNYAGECKGYCALKRNEQKPILDVKASDWYVSKVDGKIHNMYYSVDKVEPKFHEGEWIVQGDNILKIKCVGNTYYCYETVGGYVDDMLVSEIDSQFHLWTIQDAKDGDVLATSAGAFIYNGKRDGISCPGSYCGINTLGRFQIGGEKHWTGKKVYPATKEQRDMLFTKMKEAGYEWNNEKKELKKIEQNPVNKVEPKFHPGDWVIDNVGNTYQIESATEIESEHIFGYTIVGGGYFNDNNDVRLWSIDDAKRGDVLVDAYGNIGMFDKCYDFDWMSFCSLGNNGGFQYFTVEHENEKTHPATKEQRDLLFTKMEEEGYEYDNEKKELKKIESKTLDAAKVIEWLRQNNCAACWDNPDEGISQRIEQFKKDFKL